MKRIVKLTESDLNRIVRRVIKEQSVIKGVDGVEAYTNITNNLAKTKYNKLYNAVAGLGTDEDAFLSTIESILSKEEYDRINAIAIKAGEDIPTLFFGDFSFKPSIKIFCNKLKKLKVPLPKKCGV